VKRIAPTLAIVAACAGGRPSVPPVAATAPASAPAPAPAPARASAPELPLTTACPPGMVALPGVCIDEYEAPNLRGELPIAQATAYDGERWCAERGKRLCYDDEWLRACEGPHGHRFPYGDTHRDGACNDDRPWIEVRWGALATWPEDEAVTEGTRLFQADMSGARADCVSDEGVFDLTGNVAEWVRRRGPAPRPGWEHVLKGCYWAGCYHQPEPTCGFTNHAHPGTFRTYEAGFRCCVER
jgi:sulfatase modifying factor 1